MVRIINVISIALFVIFLLLLLYPIDDVDRCLDQGGCWDETDGVCRKDEPNAQMLCDRGTKDRTP